MQDIFRKYIIIDIWTIYDTVNSVICIFYTTVSIRNAAESFNFNFNFFTNFILFYYPGERKFQLD